MAKVASTPVGKYLDSSTTLPGLKVAETPVGTYVDSSTTLPTLKVPATPVGTIVIEDPSPIVDSAKASCPIAPTPKDITRLVHLLRVFLLYG